MAYQAFPIFNPRIGMQRDMEPWLLPDEAYPDLEDCYLWRGRIKKRLGFNLLGRLQRQIGTTDGSGNATITLPTVGGNPIPSMITSIIVGTAFFQDPGGASPVTMLTAGPGTATLNRSTGVLTITGSNATTAVIYQPGLPVMGLRNLQTLSGTQEIINATTLIAFDTQFAYQYNTSTQVFQDLSFYRGTVLAPVPVVWTGSNSQLFWTTNYQNAMFATNNNPGVQFSVITNISSAASAVITYSGPATFVNGDIIAITNVVGTNANVVNGIKGTVTATTGGGSPITVNINTTTLTYTSGGILHSLTRTQSGDGIRWLDQDLSNGSNTGWVNFSPPLNASLTGTNVTILQGALVILPFKNRLLMFSTTEGTSSSSKATFFQRVRWSQNGTIYYNNFIPSQYQGGSQQDAWRDDIVGRGGFLDAPTQEQIVAVQSIKDNIIVYFEQSTWQLRYTGNETLPFVFQKINTELGAVSTFSSVPFDKVTIAVGNVGIHACDIVNVDRIDQKIPDVVFDIQNANSGNERVFGIRDFFHQLVYWSIPYNGDLPDTSDLIFPNKILVYNYVDQSFSFFNDSFTCFGYFQNTVNPESLTWGNADMTWGEADFLWVDEEYDAGFVDVVGGNQLGFVETLMKKTYNSDSLFISNIVTSMGTCTVTVPNHNLHLFGDATPGPFVIITAGSLTNVGTANIYKVLEIVDDNNFTLAPINPPVNTLPSGTFDGKGTITIVNNISILTKRFNPFIQESSQVRLGYMDFYFNRTTAGQVTVYVYLDDDNSDFIDGTVPTFPESTYSSSPDKSLTNEKLWKRNYFKTISQLFQLQITMNDAQMQNFDISSSDIVLHGLIMYFSKSGRLINV